MKINFNKIGLITDTHYGVHRNNQKWVEIAKKNMEWAVAEFEKRNIKDVIIPGDVFHDRTEVSVYVLHEVSKIFDLLNDFNVIITVGNHDAFYKDKSDVNSISILKGRTNVHILEKTEVIEAFGKRIGFTNWGVLPEEIPVCDILFGHFEIISFELNALRKCEHGIPPEEISKKAKLVITGHFHKRQTKELENGSRIVYLGTPYEMDWGDCGIDKGIHILDVKTNYLEFIKNEINPKHLKFNYSSIKNSYKTLDCIKNNILKIDFDEKVDDSVMEEFLKHFYANNPMELTYSTFQMKEDKMEEVDIETLGNNLTETIDEYIESASFIKKKEKVREYINNILVKKS